MKKVIVCMMFLILFGCGCGYEQRYEVVSDSGICILVDKGTGNTWLLYGGCFNKIPRK